MILIIPILIFLIPRILSFIFGYRAKSFGLITLIEWTIIDILINAPIVYIIVLLGGSGDGDTQPLTPSKEHDLLLFVSVIVLFLLLVDILFLSLGAINKENNTKKDPEQKKLDSNISNTLQNPDKNADDIISNSPTTNQTA